MASDKGGTGIPEDVPEKFLCIHFLSSLYHRIHTHGPPLHLATELLKVMIECLSKKLRRPYIYGSPCTNAYIFTYA